MPARSRIIAFAAVVAGTLLLSACSETQLMSHWVKKWQGQEETAGTYKIGSPYRVGSVWYYPHEDFSMSETGIASWYGPDFHGHRTANGEVYDQNELTAAHRTLQMPSLVRVTNLENGRSVVVRVNDRGPYARGRIIDVSKRAAELLGFIGHGTARVRLDVLQRESRQIAEAAKRGVDTSRLTMADLDRYGAPDGTAMAATPVSATSIQRGPQVASLDSDVTMPDSLRTPTITVEQLSAPGVPQASPAPAPAPAPQPAWHNEAPAAAPVTQDDRRNFVNSLGLDNGSGGNNNSAGMVPGHMNRGHFMPDPVVSHEPVTPTGIFVQAGAFAVRANAERLRERFQGMAPVIIEPMQTAQGRTLYRVKLGPLPSVEKADALLSRVIAAGNETARVIRR